MRYAQYDGVAWKMEAAEGARPCPRTQRSGSNPLIRVRVHNPTATPNRQATGRRWKREAIWTPVLPRSPKQVVAVKVEVDMIKEHLVARHLRPSWCVGGKSCGGIQQNE